MVSNWPPEAPEPSHLSAEVDPDSAWDESDKAPTFALYANASDLLSALRQCVAHLESLDHACDALIRQDRADARRLIAKAEGRK